ncbi:MAG TPA: chromosomal replication initiator protein DnaA [Acidimicrobiia bacterium]|nr:chromosomal replication initiator protein DnaA [Acidimicrobiia bacterium]
MDNRDDEDYANRAGAEDLWSKVSLAVQSQLAESTWNTWFRGVRALALRADDDVLVLAVPSALAVERIRRSYVGILNDAAQTLSGTPMRCDFVVETDPRELELMDLPPVVTPAPQHEAPAPLLAAVDEAEPRTKGSLNPKCTFENFIVGSSNRFAQAASLSVAESPARTYNPLFIYGPAGLGKTHLLQAIGQHVLYLFTTKHVRYVSTETMMNEFVDAMRLKSMPSFKRRYREVDVLLVDDIQFLERTEQLQEEFFHTFNDLHARGSQIVISSDRPPKSIATIEDRLRSRFEWGLIVDIQPPELETRLAILRKKAQSEGLTGIPPEVFEYIAKNVVDNVRELEGAITRVAAYSTLHRAKLTEEVARAVLSDILPAERRRQITPDLILSETAEMFRFPIEELIGKSRRRPLVNARQICMYVFRELTDYSYPQIAKVFGGRDHTTVMHAYEKIRGQLPEKLLVFDQVNELINRIKHGSPA